MLFTLKPQVIFNVVKYSKGRQIVNVNVNYNIIVIQ